MDPLSSRGGDLAIFLWDIPFDLNALRNAQVRLYCSKIFVHPAPLADHIAACRESVQCGPQVFSADGTPRTLNSLPSAVKALIYPTILQHRDVSK